MNPFDLIIAAVLVLSVVYAVYRGAVQTVLNTGALILAVLLAYPLSLPLSNAVAGNTAITSQLLTYTDALARVGEKARETIPIPWSRLLDDVLVRYRGLL